MRKNYLIGNAGTKNTSELDTKNEMKVNLIATSLRGCTTAYWMKSWADRSDLKEWIMCQTVMFTGPNDSYVDAFRIKTLSWIIIIDIIIISILLLLF